MSLDPSTWHVDQVGAWTAAIAAGLTALAVGVRRLSTTRTELTKDDAEREVLKLLLKERDAARAELQACQASQRLQGANLARVEAERTALQREVGKLGDEFGAFQRKIARLYPETKGFMDSDVMPWTEHKPR